MQTKYKYIHFAEVDDQQWACCNTRQGAALGWIEWYKPWKQYVIRFSDHADFNASCLDDISHFLKQLNGAGVSNG